MDAKTHAIFLARRLLSESVFNMSTMEDNPFSYIEVETLLDGVTVGGHKLSDENQVLRIAAGWEKLLSDVEKGEFELSAAYAKALHAIVAENEARKWGAFRDEAVAVRGTSYTPPRHRQLAELFENMLNRVLAIQDTSDRAIAVFLDFARNQYFFDGNKRTGQLMMNGVLLSDGFPIITIPAQERREYGYRLIHFYDYNDDSKIRPFLLECQIKITDDGIVRSGVPKVDPPQTQNDEFD